MNRFCTFILSLLALQILIPAHAKAQQNALGDMSKPILLMRTNPADKDMVATNTVMGEPNKAAIKKALKAAIDPKLLNLPRDERLAAMQKALLKGTVILEGHDKPIISMAWSKDGKSIVTGSRDGTARIWNPKSGQQIHRLENESPVVLVAFSPSGKQLLTGPGVPNQSDIHEALRKKSPLNTSGKITLWDSATGKSVKEFAAGPKELLGVAISPKWDIVVGAGLDKSLCVWSVASGKLLHKWELEAPLVQIRFTPDGNLLGAGFYEKVIRVFNTSTYKELAPLEGMKGPVFGFTISTDSKFVLATCDPKFSTPLDEKNSFERTVVGVATLGISEVANAFQTQNETPTMLWHLPTRKVRFEGLGKNFSVREMAEFGFDFLEAFNAMR